jgi:hypothetical protein
MSKTESMREFAMCAGLRQGLQLVAGSGMVIPKPLTLQAWLAAPNPQNTGNQVCIIPDCCDTRAPADSAYCPLPFRRPRDIRSGEKQRCR